MSYCIYFCVGTCRRIRHPSGALQLSTPGTKDLVTKTIVKIIGWLSSNVPGIVIILNMKEIEMGYRGSKIITKVIVKEQ